MSNCEYIREYYGVPASINMRIEYKGEGGIIWRDGGNYVCACMDKDKPGVTINIHPTDPDLKYLEMGRPREMTRAQRKYDEYRRSESGQSFAEWMGFSLNKQTGGGA